MAGDRRGRYAPRADVRADQGVVADDAQEEADQNRREGREPRPLCHVPDGGSGDCSKSLRRHPAHDSRTSAAADSVNSVVRLVVTSSIETTGKVCLDDGKRYNF
jgi:hypothetical protein